MTTPDASAVSPLRRITVEDINRAFDFVLALNVFFHDDLAVFEGDGGVSSLPYIAQKSREPRDLFWAPEAYRPNQEVDLHQQELQHAMWVLAALSRGDFLIPGDESPWEDWDGEAPAEADVVLLCPACQTCEGATPELAAAHLEAHIRAVVAATPLTSEMRHRLTLLLQDPS